MEREDKFTVQSHFTGPVRFTGPVHFEGLVVVDDSNRYPDANGYSGAVAYAAMVVGFKAKRRADAGYWRIDAGTGRLTFGDADGNETTDGDPSLVAMNMAAHDWEIFL